VSVHVADTPLSFVVFASPMMTPPVGSRLRSNRVSPLLSTGWDFGFFGLGSLRICLDLEIERGRRSLAIVAKFETEMLTGRHVSQSDLAQFLAVDEILASVLNIRQESEAAIRVPQFRGANVSHLIDLPLPHSSSPPGARRSPPSVADSGSCEATGHDRDQPEGTPP
jgi:hypothetical protein